MHTHGTTARTRQLALVIALTCTASVSGPCRRRQRDAVHRIHEDRSSGRRSFVLQFAGHITGSRHPEVAARDFVASHATRTRHAERHRHSRRRTDGCRSRRRTRAHDPDPSRHPGVRRRRCRHHQRRAPGHDGQQYHHRRHRGRHRTHRSTQHAPSRSPATALKTDARSIGTPDAAALVVFRAADGSDHLAYRVTLTREEPAGDWELIVDAESGAVLQQNDMFVDYT